MGGPKGPGKRGCRPTEAGATALVSQAPSVSSQNLCVEILAPKGWRLKAGSPGGDMVVRVDPL